MRYPVFLAPLPLKLGILRDLVADGHSPGFASRWLAHHTAKPEYLAACAAPGAMRHDLAGNPVEPVSDTHRAFAAESLSKALKRPVAGLAAIPATSVPPKAVIDPAVAAKKAASLAKAIAARRHELGGKK